MSKSNPTGAVVALLAICMLVLGPNTAAAQESDLQFHDGLVTLVARDVTVRTILSQWGQTGRSTVVNGDKVDGPPVTLQLVDVPEREALAILLRNVGGYILAARHDFQPGTSAFDRIVIVAQSGVRNGSSQLAAQPTPPPVFYGSPEMERPGIANQSAEPIVDSPPPPNAAAPAAAPFALGAPAPFAPQGSPRGAAGAPMGASAPKGASIGTTRPGEIATPPPVTRTSPGPQRQQQ